MNKKKLLLLCFVTTLLNTFMIQPCWDWLCCCFTNKEEKNIYPKKDSTRMSVIAATLTAPQDGNQSAHDSSYRNDPKNTHSPSSPSSAKAHNGLYQNPSYGSFGDDGFKKEHHQKVLIAQANE